MRICNWSTRVSTAAAMMLLTATSVSAQQAESYNSARHSQAAYSRPPATPDLATLASHLGRYPRSQYSMSPYAAHGQASVAGHGSDAASFIDGGPFVVHAGSAACDDEDWTDRYERGWHRLCAKWESRVNRWIAHCYDDDCYDECDECDAEYYDECDDDHPGRCLGDCLHCKLGYFCPQGCCGAGCPILDAYHLAYAVNPEYFDERDGRVYAAQGYGVPMAVPLAPTVNHTYNFGWGIPSSRLTPISTFYPEYGYIGR